MSGFLITFITWLFQALNIAILGRVIMSWIDPMGNMGITRFFQELTEPILGPIRRVIPSLGMFDLSPIIALLLISVLQRLIVSALL
jgi:YggT family protein